MKKRRLLLAMVAMLLAAAPAMATPPNYCTKTQALINPGNQNVSDVTVINGSRSSTVVTLNGANSNPQDKVTCVWTQYDSDPQKVTIDNPNSCTTTFTAPDVGSSGQSFNFHLQVTSTQTDCTFKDNSDKTDGKDTTVNVTNFINHPPVASAVVVDLTTPYSVNAGTSVNLDGSGSYDPDHETISYSWQQIIDPAHPTTPVTINNQNGPYANFTAPPELSPNGETLTIRLTVSDGYLSSSTDILITVISTNQPPIASIACPGPIKEGEQVTLDGSGSSDPEAGTLTYQWSQIVGVPNANLSGVDLTSASIKFTAPYLDTNPNDTMKFGLTVTDNGSLSSSAECDVKILDVTAPVISGISNITAEATSPAGAAVTFNPTAYDAHYGDETVTCDPTSGSTFGINKTTSKTTVVNCSASDQADPPNTATASFNVTVQDTTPPALTLPGPIGPIEGNTLGGANNITYSASALDVVDGSVPVTCAPASSSSFVFPVGTIAVNCSATDAHGNPATGSFNVTVKDTTPPAITVTADTIADGSSFYFGFVPAAPTCTAYDIVSGNVSCTVNGYSTLVGSHILTMTASDKTTPPNTATITRNYNVMAWTLKGFYSPVTMGGVTNTVKAGSTVPLKFQIFAGPSELTTTSSVSSIRTEQISCDFTSSDQDVILDALATGGTSLRYDTTAGQFIYNWQTPKSSGLCYKVTATTLDGSAMVANFKLK